MSLWELLLCCLITVVGLLPLLMMKPGIRWRAGVISVTAVLFTIPWLAARSRDRTVTPRDAFPAAGEVPPSDIGQDYVSSQTCRVCHPGSYESWHRTFHRTMTQIANPQTVIAPFDDIQLESQGRSYHFQQEGDTFWVTMPDPEKEAWLKNDEGVDLHSLSEADTQGLQVKRQVVMTTGSHHMQTYWVRSPTAGNHLRQVPWYFLKEDHRWVPREDIALMPPDRPRTFPLWNASCITCHSTAGNPGMDRTQNVLFSKVAELGIACEACHGPAEQHVRHHRNPVNRYRQYRSDDPDPTIVNPARCASKVSSQICGQCHSHYDFVDFSNILADGPVYRPGDELAVSQRVIRFGSDDHQDLAKAGKAIYWDDAACRTGGDEFNGLMESACFQRGDLSCLSCHSMHSSDPNDQLTKDMDGNRACLQCHTSYENQIEAHTHHTAGSSGSQCYNCHMPHTSFALLTAMRSHRIDSPSVTMSVRSGRPNACNLCHLDKTLEWTSQKLSDWYGMERVELSQDETNIAASVLWILRGDAIQRVVAAWHMGWQPALQASGSDWQPPFLSRLLEDPYSVVRYVAHRSLKSLPGFQDFSFDYIAPSTNRSMNREQADTIWQRRSANSPVPENSRILVTPTGGLRHDEIQRLLEQRNDRPVWVLE